MKPKVSITHRDQLPGKPSSYGEDAVSAVYEMVKENIESVVDINEVIKPGDKVFLKLNACWPVEPDSGIANDPRIVAAVVRYLKQNTGARSIIIGERASIAADTFAALKQTGIYEAALREGADEIIPLERDVRVKVRIPGAKVLTRDLHLPRSLMQADKVIYLAKMKTHKVATVTLSMKLTQGLLPWSEIFLNHKRDIDQKIVDLLRLVKPDLAIVDGLWPMQGQGPGSPYKEDLIKDFNTVVAGTDPVAVDAVCSKLMGFDPMFEVATVRGATMEGLGEGRLENIEVVGEKIEKLQRNFRRGYISLTGLHPKVTSYVSGGCRGCTHFTRTGFEPWLADEEKMKELEQVEQITLIVGKNEGIDIKYKHNPPHSYTFVIGDCAEEHRDKGIYLPGCPSLSLHGLMPFFGLTDEEIKAKYEGRYPHGFVP